MSDQVIKTEDIYTMATRLEQSKRESLGLDQLKELNRRLSGLLDDPQPGLYTWHKMLSECLIEMALYCGHILVIKACEQVRQSK